MRMTVGEWAKSTEGRAGGFGRAVGLGVVVCGLMGGVVHAQSKTEGTGTAATQGAVSGPGEQEGGKLATVDVPPSRRQTKLYGLVSGGFVYRWALREHLFGGVLEGELGARDHRIAGGARIRVEAGKMLAGLPYQVVAVGPSLWLPRVAQRIWFGMGVDTGVLLLNRRTEPGTAMWTVLWGGRVEMVADLLKIGERGGLYCGTGLTAQALTQAPFPLTLSTGFWVGYRP